MFRFFRRRKDKPSVVYGVFQKMSDAVEGRQRKAADYLNGKTAHWSQKQLLIGLICFALLFGGSAAYVIWRAFERPARTVRVQPVKPSGHVLQPDKEPVGAVMLTKEEIRNIRAFRRHLDSLQQTATGKRVYDSIARHRPGLLDSLAIIEQIYSQQLKTGEDGKTK